jgi:hypothetical protein
VLADNGVMTRLLIVLTWLAIFCVAHSRGSVQARSCAAPEAFEVEYRRSAAVFSGRVQALKVVRVHDGAFGLVTVATFEVQNWWKGGRSKFVDVRSCGGIEGDVEIICTHGFEFELGVSYVVFATGRPLETSLCLRTNTVEKSADVLKWLHSRNPK